MTTAGSPVAAPVWQLFPSPARELALRGLYLDDALRPNGTPERPFVYASFISSLGGRISLPDAATGVRKPPPSITNPRDWRLFQELAAAADVVVTSGRYIRDLGEGAAQSGVPVIAGPEFSDLHAWRRAHGLAPQPALAIVTAHADVPIPEHLLASSRRIYLAIPAGAGPPPHALTARGVRALPCGEARVDGHALVTALANEGFGNVDMIAGGALLHTLLAAGAFHRLYLTQAFRLLGGESFDTLMKGPPLDPPADFALRALILDAAQRDRPGQTFSVFDCTSANQRIRT